MAVFRIEKTRDFTVMSNHHLKNRNLTLKAKGLLSMILSLPDDWHYTARGLASICKEGVDSISGAIKELEQAGYSAIFEQSIIGFQRTLGDVSKRTRHLSISSPA